MAFTSQPKNVVKITQLFFHCTDCHSNRIFTPSFRNWGGQVCNKHRKSTLAGWERVGGGTFNSKLCVLNDD